MSTLQLCRWQEVGSGTQALMNIESERTFYKQSAQNVSTAEPVSTPAGVPPIGATEFNTYTADRLSIVDVHRLLCKRNHGITIPAGRFDPGIVADSQLVTVAEGGQCCSHEFGSGDDIWRFSLGSGFEFNQAWEPTPGGFEYVRVMHRFYPAQPEDDFAWLLTERADCRITVHIREYINLLRRFSFNHPSELSSPWCKS